ncbi:MAG: DUF445 domain-containing protein [Candidatus Viridilinea halotolerans]|uniref:DUF445 domain-containing protein n=1 Tax=Candidatus Viridilinea halotolerans TaxID=2491704 RepID=A0A426TRX4_9CHLR|nr:MAG: DUF445 domain-containing protein [Candidatus Viridilinea halotolerans]
MNETQRIQQLQRMQRIATGLLVAMALTFAITSYFHDVAPWVGFVRAFAEAAMVGAIADWFAVTALFRHPLGLPIPHTAIVPRRKDSIAESFGGFIERNFLDPDKIVARLRNQDMAGRLARWLRNPQRSAQVADLAAEGLVGLLRVANDDEVGALLQRTLDDRMRAIPATTLVARLLGVVVVEQRQRDVLLQLARVATDWIEENQALIRKRIAGELPAWMPRIVEKKIYERLLDGVRKLLAELSENPNHPLYAQFTQTLEGWIANLQYDPDVRARGEELKQEVLNHPILREMAGNLWQDLKGGILQQSSAANSPLRLSIARGLAHLGDVLESDPDWRERVDGWAEDLTRYIVGRYGRVAGDFVTQTVKGWEASDVSRKIELQFGRDLQFIRINGTVVGGFVGLLIHIVSHFFY